MQSLIILGRQPKIGLAELESLYGADKLQPVGTEAVLIDLPHEQIDFSRLGGMVKFCKVLTTLDTTNWQDIQKHLIGNVPKHLDSLPEGKLQLGLSVYGLSINARQILASGLELKKVIRSAGRSVRLVPNDEPALNSAKVLHNHLNGPLGWELVLVKDGNKTILAQTIAVQDITAYAKRDQARPRRDSKVGMLPPKLAQTIINLAVGEWQPNGNREPECDPEKGPAKSLDLLDPFCGTGVILQEALLMGFIVQGTDIDPRMVEYAKANMSWLDKQIGFDGTAYLNDISVADATSNTWKSNPDIVASEVYLGRPLSSPPSPSVLKEIIQDVNTITKKFLKNLAPQVKPGFRLCIAVPAWKSGKGFEHLPLLDSLEELGYNRLSFVHAAKEDLIYHREGQYVARELVVLQRL